MSKAKTINKKSTSEESSTQQERQLATDLELISLLRENDDILKRHPELLAILEVPHETGKAVSLIERQVAVLRQKTQTQDQRLCELMDVARDNERLAASRHSLAINLLAAHDLDDVISTVLDVLSNELSSDFTVIKLFSEDAQRLERAPDLFVDANDKALTAFKTMLEHKNIVCGKSTPEQKTFLFEDNADIIQSAAIIPLIAGANLGLIGLGSNQAMRFSSAMGTDFLSQIGELISASLAVHLESNNGE